MFFTDVLNENDKKNDKHVSSEPEEENKECEESQNEENENEERKEDAEDSKTTEPEVLLESFASGFQTSGGGVGSSSSDGGRGGGCNEHEFNSIHNILLPQGISNVSRMSSLNSTMTWRQYCNRLLHNSRYKSYHLSDEQVTNSKHFTSFND